MSTLLSACWPPFKILDCGTGRSLALTPPKYRYRGRPDISAPALAQARDTARIELAPSFPLFSVPSSSIMAKSISRCLRQSMQLLSLLLQLLDFPGNQVFLGHEH